MSDMDSSLRSSTPSSRDVLERLASGDAHLSIWWTEGGAESLQRAVIEYRAALKLCTPDLEEERTRAQIWLSGALRLQFEEGLGGDDDDEVLFREALSLAQTAVQDAQVQTAVLQFHATRALGETYLRRGHSKDHLQQAAETFRNLVNLAEELQSDLLVKALALHAQALQEEFEQLSRDPKKVHLANAAVDRALALLTEEDEVPHDLICARAGARVRRGILTLQKNDLDEGVSVMQGLIDDCPRTHPRLYRYYNLFGYSCSNRHVMSGSDEDLDRYLAASGEICELVSPSHPLWHNAYESRAVSLFNLFAIRGDLGALREAIDVSRSALNHIMASLPGRKLHGDITATNLARMLTSLYSQTGNLDLLNEAITLQLDNLTRVPGPRRAWSLLCISTAYRSRFMAQGRFADLQTAASLLEQILDSADVGDRRPEITHALADVLISMYNENKEVALVHRAISLLQTFLASYWPHPQDRGECQSMLGAALLIRASITSRIGDIEESAECQKRALELLPQGNPSQQTCYFRLGQAEFQRFVVGGHRDGIDNSIAAFNRALSLTSLEYASRARYLSHLSKALLALSDMEGSDTVFMEASSRLQEAAKHSASWLGDRYDAAVEWARTSHQKGDLPRAIEGYHLAIAMLPELASFGLEDELRVQHLSKQAGEVPQDAAACALEMGQPQLAIELLEAGRTILWNSGQELRVDVARLKDVAPELAKELAETNAALEFRPQAEPSTDEQETERRRLHRLAFRRTELINQVRSYAGFEHFLLPPKYDSLRQAAAHGPIVVINSSAYRCDALIIQADQEITVMHLPRVNSDQIKKEAMTLQYSLAVASRDRRGQRFLEVVLQRLLHSLWVSVGDCVSAALRDYLSASEVPRVWWCPTGAMCFLPIHACCPYGGANPRQLGMADIVVSSYTPTISALSRAQRRKPSVESAASHSMLVVSLPNAPGHPPLPGATNEMRILESLFPKSGSFLVGPEATVLAVEARLQENGWLHVISHGIQNSRHPLDSAIVLYDGPLNLSRLAQAHLPNAEFAFLSACHSAKGTALVPDESMHLAAGMMFSGFRSVVATSWAIADSDAPEVARKFYTHLTARSSLPRAADAAEALHQAVRNLRKTGVPAQRWVPFIHLGA